MASLPSNCAIGPSEVLNSSLTTSYCAIGPSEVLNSSLTPSYCVTVDAGI